MANDITLPQLTTALDNLAWELAQAEADKLPPYLQDDELTVDRFTERNKDKMSETEARNLLEALVVNGMLEKQERRVKGKGGAHAVVYLAVKK